MPRKFLKQFLPDPQKMAEHPHLKHFGERLTDPKLWHLNRRSVSGAVALGLFIAFMPIPGQMILAVLLALYFQFNLPIAALGVWITNPLTVAPLFFFAYKVGSWILQVPVEEHHFSLSIQWFTEELIIIWQPLLLGCLICALTASLLGVLLVRLIWRVSVARSWIHRKRQRSNR